MLSSFGVAALLFGMAASQTPEMPSQSGDNRQLLGTSGFRHEGNITAAAITNEGTLCATAAEDETIAVWETPSGKRLSSPLGHRGKILSLAFSVDGQALLGGSQNGRLH